MSALDQEILHNLDQAEEFLDKAISAESSNILQGCAMVRAHIRRAMTEIAMAKEVIEEI